MKWLRPMIGSLAVLGRHFRGNQGLSLRWISPGMNHVYTTANGLSEHNLNDAKLNAASGFIHIRFSAKASNCVHS